MRSLDTITAEIGEKIVEICHQQNITKYICTPVMCQISEEVKVKVEVDFTPTETAVMMWSKKKHWNLAPLPCR